MKGVKNILSSKYWWVVLLIFLIGINFLASIAHSRLDLTKEKRYTLSKATKELIKNLDDDVQIDVFLKGEFPAGFRKFTNSVSEFLELLKERSNSRIHYQFISPKEIVPETNGRTYADTLESLGAYSINLKAQLKTGESSNLIYPFALIKYKRRQALASLFKASNSKPPEAVINNSEALLEFEFAKTIDEVINPNKPLVAYAIGNGEPEIGYQITNETPYFRDARTADLQGSLGRDYQLFTFNLNTQKIIPDTFKALLIVKPTLQFTEEEKLKIDQYVMRGGKLICFIDNLNAEQDSLRYKPQLIAYDRNLNLTDLFFKYGARINTNLVMDLQCDFMPFLVGGSADNPQYEFLHWNYYPLFESNGNHTINKNIGLVAGRFVNSIDTITAAGIKKTVLLSSSSNSRIIGTPALISLNENRNSPEDALFKKSNIPVAVLLEGKFTSLFRNRASTAQMDSLSSYGTPFKEQSSDDNKIIVVGDGDMVLNDISPKNGPLPMGLNFFNLNTQYEYQFANKDFLMNSLEYLVNKPGIIETRNKDIVLRLLDTKKVNEQKLTWQLINIVLPILLIILFGAIYQQIRKRKYS